jgi:hypothetical protein
MEHFVRAAVVLICWIIVTGTFYYVEHKYVYHTGRTRKVINRRTFFVGVLGFIFSAYAFVVDYRQRVTTLYEDFVKGSIGVKVNTEAPIREITFNVEHPGVEHQLSVKPSLNFGQSPSGDVTVSIRLLDGKNNVIINVTEIFKVITPARSKVQWDDKSYRFTPSDKGSHTLLISPITIGIPEIFVRIEDPEKTDGKRTPGY